MDASSVMSSATGLDARWSDLIQTFRQRRRQGSVQSQRISAPALNVVPAPAEPTLNDDLSLLQQHVMQNQDESDSERTVVAEPLHAVVSDRRDQMDQMINEEMEFWERVEQQIQAVRFNIDGEELMPLDDDLDQLDENGVLKISTGTRQQRAYDDEGRDGELNHVPVLSDWVACVFSPSSQGQLVKDFVGR